MRHVSYERHELTWPEPEARRAPLLTFVYDVPYLSACGVFPPLHILNQILRSGGGQGGMSSGATWEPFEIAVHEYDELVEGVVALDPRTLGGSARYTEIAFTFDDSFDEIETHLDWLRSVCAKHRDAYHEKMRRAQLDST